MAPPKCRSGRPPWRLTGRWPDDGKRWRTRDDRICRIRPAHDDRHEAHSSKGGHRDKGALPDGAQMEGMAPINGMIAARGSTRSRGVPPASRSFRLVVAASRERLFRRRVAGERS